MGQKQLSDPNQPQAERLVLLLAQLTKSSISASPQTKACPRRENESSVKTKSKSATGHNTVAPTHHPNPSKRTCTVEKMRKKKCTGRAKMLWVQSSSIHHRRATGSGKISLRHKGNPNTQQPAATRAKKRQNSAVAGPLNTINETGR